jgi:ADP-heptose:LPS heptosyltransferase
MKRTLYTNIVIIFLLSMFVFDSTAGYCADSLQVWSKIKNPTKEFIVESNLKNALERIKGNIGIFDERLTPVVEGDIRLVLDFHPKLSAGSVQGKRREGNNWIVYCSLSKGSEMWEWEAVIANDKTFTLSPLPDRTGKKYSIQHKEGTAVRPLNGIDPAGIKNILVYTDTLEKLGDTAISLWPLVSGLYEKFPNATIHVKSRFFRDIFASRIFQDRIKDATVSWRFKTSDDAVAFVRQNDVDMVFELTDKFGFSGKLTEDVPSGAKQPYIFSMLPPSILDSAACFIDKDGAKYRITGEEGLRELAMRRVKAVDRQGIYPIRERGSEPSSWLYAVEAYKLMGLDIDEDDLPANMPTLEEAVDGLSIIKKWYDDLYPQEASSRFDPSKKIIGINVYAVTQDSFLKDDEWVVAIAELMKRTKNAYFLFTHGGPMDEDISRIERIVREVNAELVRQGLDPSDPAMAQIIIPRVENIYPYIHDIFGVTTAFVTVDTGIGHLASGVYDIPTAILTHEGILHWFPPRANASAVIIPQITNVEMRLLLDSGHYDTDAMLAGFNKMRMDRIRAEMADFAKIINDNPERPAVQTAKRAAASISERAGLDKELVKNSRDEDCAVAKNDLKKYVDARLEALGVSSLVSMPPMIFVDSSTQTEVNAPRFTTKLYTDDDGVTYLMIDRNALYRAAGGTLLVRREIKDVDVMHEVMGHLLARSLFAAFKEAHLPGYLARQEGAERTKEKMVVPIRRAEEELAARLMTLIAMHRLLSVDKDLVSHDTRKRIESLDIDLANMDLDKYIEAAVRWMKSDKSLNALRYRWLMTPSLELRLKDRTRSDYLAGILKAFGAEHYADKWGNMRDLSDPKGLSSAFMENIVSAGLTHKIVLAFDSNVAGIQSRLALAVIEEINNLKKEPKFEKFLNNVTVVISEADLLPKKLRDHIGRDDTAVFVFAKENSRPFLKSIEPKVNAVYIKDSNVDYNSSAYQPLCEIVTLTLARFLSDPEEIDKLRSIIENRLMIRMDTEAGGILVFSFLETPKTFDTNEDLVKRYSLLKRLLSSA